MDISSIGDLLEVIWEGEGGRLKGEEVEISQLSIRSLVHPVPMEPRDTLQKRVAYSACVNRSADTGNKDEVPSSWCDPENLHVYLYVDSGPGRAAPSEVRVAEHLYNTLWGKDLNVILEEVSDDDGTTWKYVPGTHIDSLRMEVLGYPESRGLLVRPEYDIALGMLNEGYKTAKNDQRGGVVVTGQPGIGRTCFLYYLLLHKLSEMEPVALERPGFFILFHDGGVYTLPLNARPEYIPDGTWALSDGNDEPYQPCSVFLTASKRRTAWVIQTTSQVEARWRRWRKYSRAVMFVMNHVSIEEITALSKVFNLDVNNIQRLYRKWGPSAARTCLQLLLEGEEGLHEREVMKAAGHFVHNPHTIASLDESRVSGLLFPSNQS